MLEIFFAGAATATVGFWLGFFTYGAMLRKERKDE